MPTECERSATSLAVGEQQQDNIQQQTQQFLQQERKDFDCDMMEGKETINGDMSTSQTSQTSTTSSNGHNGNTNGMGKKVAITSPDPTAYVAKARVTRPTPPPPSYNPMQFVQIKPCNLYQTAQQQLKKAEEVKKIKEIKKEEPEDWQNNLDNWKSSRRKRVEHIIDRVVEVKKLELEEHDRTRRKSKTFSEMIEERGDRPGRTRAKLTSLAVYKEDEANDLSDLGIGTSSASGKSSLSEDYDNNSVMSDNADLDKAIFETNHKLNSTTREYISSPGYDTSSSTAPASSPDPCEYTYEGAIQDYKQRVARVMSNSGINYKLNSNNNIKTNSSTASKESTPERANSVMTEFYPTRRGSKIEDRLIGFEVTSPSDSQEGAEKQKVDLPKIDISKRKEIFENQQYSHNEPKLPINAGVVPKVTLRDRFKMDTAANTTNSDAQAQVKKEVKRLSGDITSIRDRLQSLEQQQNLVNSTNGVTKSTTSKLVDIPVPPLKERLSSLHNAVTKEELKKPPVVLVDARQLEIMKNEEETAKLRLQQLEATSAGSTTADLVPTKIDCPVISIQSDVDVDVDRDDSGIHTSDDIEVEERIAEQLKIEQEQQLNAAIAALALEERQLEEAANAVNQIEAEFAELASNPSPLPSLGSITNEQPCEMDFSVSSTNNFHNHNLNINSSNNSSKIGSSAGKAEAKCISNDNVVKTDEVLGYLNVPNTASNLRRKPSNEMVHARNLLKMFKETFNNDIDLDEDADAEDVATAVSNVGKLKVDTTNVIAVNSPTSTQKVQFTESNNTPKAPLSPNIKTEIYDTGRTTPIAITNPNTIASSTKSPINSPIATQIFQSGRITPVSVPTSPTLPLKLPGTPSMIPRSINPTGKPPMSPKSAKRHMAKLPPQSPLQSPTAVRKPESQFSINGRVEIFNSKNMSNTPKPTTPTMTTKKTHLSHLPTATSPPHGKQETANANNNIGLLTEQEQQQKQQKQHTPSITALSIVTEPLSVSNAKSMPVNAVNEPHETRSPNTDAAPSAALYVATTVLKQQTIPQQQEKHQQQPEVVICAPPVTIINPDELPKPNTVKALSNCFLREDEHSKSTPPKPAPKPLPRSRIPQTPPQSPTPTQRNSANNGPTPAQKTTTTANNLVPIETIDDATRKLSIVSDISINSRDSYGQPAGPFETTAIVHSPPTDYVALKKETNCKSLKLQTNTTKVDPLKPNDTLTPKITTASAMPPLLICAPNESSLYKLATSAPASPASPATPATPAAAKHCDQPCDDDIAFCASFLSSLMPTTAKKVAQPEPLQRQQTIEEVVCDKIDVHKLPPHSNIPCTSYFEVDNEELKRCDGLTSRNASAPTTPTANTIQNNANSKPNSPIMAARAAHSKALIETCEKIIAEEREASNQMKSTLVPTPKGTPIAQRKSKIPKPIPCCTGSDSMGKADYEVVPQTANSNNDNNTTKPTDDEVLIARLHVVETQIKVTTTTPPASPKVNLKTHPNTNKKTKNIFDFLKRNFGHHEEDNNNANTTAVAAEEIAPVNVVKFDEIIKVDNSKFYVPTEDAVMPTSTAPPPLPTTPAPAPVNIEITKKITTDEIVEESISEKDLSQEINDLLDDELNKLSLDSDAVVVNNVVKKN